MRKRFSPNTFIRSSRSRYLISRVPGLRHAGRHPRAFGFRLCGRCPRFAYGFVDLRMVVLERCPETCAMSMVRIAGRCRVGGRDRTGCILKSEIVVGDRALPMALRRRALCRIPVRGCRRFWLRLLRETRRVRCGAALPARSATTVRVEGRRRAFQVKADGCLGSVVCCRRCTARRVMTAGGVRSPV